MLRPVLTSLAPSMRLDKRLFSYLLLLHHLLIFPHLKEYGAPSKVCSVHVYVFVECNWMKVSNDSSYSYMYMHLCVHNFNKI